MHYSTFSIITDGWNNMSNLALSMEEIPLSEMQELLKDTYYTLTKIHKDELIPKDACKMLLAVDEFMCFASITEDSDRSLTSRQYQNIFHIVSALREGFFNGEYEESFPKLKIYGFNQNKIVVDFETNIFDKI